MTEISGNLTGKLLLAMPGINDPRFYRSVIFICSHDDKDGAMGLIINQAPLNLSLRQMMDQLQITPKESAYLDQPVLTGGPVDAVRGFMLHTIDFCQPETIDINKTFGLTATLEALGKIAAGDGPKEMLFILGYSGWAVGQLEQEIQANAWMVAEASHELIFNTPLEQKWDRAMGRIGVNPALLSTATGTA